MMRPNTTFFVTECKIIVFNISHLVSFCHRVSMDVLRIVVMVIAVVVTTSCSSAIPQSDEHHKSRVVDRVSTYEHLHLIDAASITCR